MFRFNTISMIVLGSAAIGNAGQIQVGGTNGLTSSYITSGCSGSTGCVAGNVSTAVEQNYDNVLFSGALNSSSPLVPYSGYSTSTASAGTLVDSTNGVTFSMINDGVTGSGLSAASNNVWGLGWINGALPTMTIPIGVFGVSDVWTMINTELASSAPPSTGGNRDVTVFFNFGTTSNATTLQTLTVKLTNSNNSTTPGGNVRNAVDCVPASGSCGGVASAASGPLQDSATVGTYTVLTNHVYTSGFTTATGVYSGATGNVNLDDQGFFFNNVSLSTLGAGLTNLNSYLVSIQVREAGSGTALSPDIASLAVSAVTIDAVPEPSTILMFLAGIGAIGFGRMRRR